MKSNQIQTYKGIGDMQYCDTHEFMGKTFFLMDFS